MPFKPDLTGQRFGTFLAVSRLWSHGREQWRCRCDCGALTVRSRASLLRTPRCRHCTPPDWLNSHCKTDVLAAMWERSGTLYSVEQENEMADDIRTAFRLSFGPTGIERVPSVDPDWFEANADLDGLLREAA